jgi:anti-sigma B factor antagonist
MTDFEINITEQSGVTMVDVLGFLDAHTFESMQETLDRVFAANKFRIAINLENVDYISSAGAGVFIGALGKAQEGGGDIVLMNPRPTVMEVFDLLGLTQIFTFLKSPKEASAHFSR